MLFIPFLLTSCATQSGEEVCFAVLGDVHYRAPDFERTGYYIPLIAQILDSQDTNPEFIIQTGDLFHAGRGIDVDAESSFAFTHFGETVNRPFFVSKGNHDRHSQYEKEALPLYSGFLGREITKSYFSFKKAHCQFIILDCTEEDLTGQFSWLKEELKTASSDPQVRHIFVAGHYPLWPVTRAGFTRPDFAGPVAILLAKYSVDAYFCGHTHNKTVTVRLIDGQPLTQIMDAAIVEAGRLFHLAPYLHHVRPDPENPLLPGMLPLEEAHQLFIPEPELLYYRGYQEGSNTSFNIISVIGGRVQVDWYVLDEGLVHSYMWEEPGKIVDLKVPVRQERKTVTSVDPAQIDQAWLYTAFWINGDSVVAPIVLNGMAAGELTLKKTVMATSPFWNKIEVEIGKTAIGSVKTDNEVIIQNPGKGEFSIAHLFLLVKLKDGRYIKSNISPMVLTSFSGIDGGLYYPPTAERYFPSAELIASVNAGMPLTSIHLRLEEVVGR